MKKFFSEPEVLRIKKECSLEQVFSLYGLRRVGNGVYQCPFHNEKKGSLNINKKHPMHYLCFGCRAKGDVIQFVRKMENLDFVAACNWLCDKFHIDCTNYSITINTDVEHVYPASSITPTDSLFDIVYLQEVYDKAHMPKAVYDYLINVRHLTPEVIEQFGLNGTTKKKTYVERNPVKYKSPYFRENSIMIPYLDIDGTMVNLSFRPLDDQGGGKYMLPKHSHWSMYHMNLLKTLQPGDLVTICEGPSDCWAATCAGFNAIALPNAGYASCIDEQTIQQLKPFRLQMFFDHDDAGEKAAKILKKKLPNLVLLDLPGGYKDFSEYWASGNFDETLYVVKH